MSISARLVSVVSGFIAVITRLAPVIPGLVSGLCPVIAGILYAASSTGSCRGIDRRLRRNRRRRGASEEQAVSEQAASAV